MARQYTIAELGKFKEKISTALYKSQDIRDLLLGDTSGMTPSQIRDAFKTHVYSHLFIDDTIQETDSFIFYDVVLPAIRPNIKTCRVVMYMICHRDILDNYTKEGYYGNRMDVLAEMVEDALLNDEDLVKEFGIGQLTLDDIDVYNSIRMYGRMLTFSVPNFRWKSS